MTDVWTNASLSNSPGLSTRGLDFIANFRSEALLPAIRILGKAKQHQPTPSLV